MTEPTPEKAAAKLGSAASPIKPMKLSFTPPAVDRSAGIPDMSPPKRTAPVQATPPPDEPVAPPQPRRAPAARVERPAESKPRGRRTRPEPVTEPDGVGVYLPSSLKRRLKTYWQNHEGTTYTEIVLDAIEANAGRLGELLDDGTPARTGPLFAGRRAKRRRHVEDQVQVTLRPSLEDLKVIDELVLEHGAIHRSYLVSRALQEYLK